MYKKKSWKEHAMTKGLIFDIQRFSVNDGPGIRTTVFFKGCGLRCAWCHNPESIASYQQLSYDPTRCDGCRKCYEHVEGHGISMINEKAIVDMEIHDRSLDLVNICPQGCFGVLGEEKSMDEIVSVIMKDWDYYIESGGGVTFSGGEALNQWSFIEPLARILKAKGLHLTLDISGYDPAGILIKTLELIDLYLLDIKASNEMIYQKYIGQNLDPEGMLKKLKSANKPVILRVPLIADVNDDSRLFDTLAQLNIAYDNIIETNLLPYHTLRKKQQFRLLNEREIFGVADNDRKNFWKSEIIRRQIRHVSMENELISQ
jgi:pyruvate formate lyase activating enzyme